VSIVVKCGQFVANLVKYDTFTRKTKVFRNFEETGRLYSKKNWKVVENLREEVPLKLNRPSLTQEIR